MFGSQFHDFKASKRKSYFKKVPKNVSKFTFNYLNKNKKPYIALYWNKSRCQKMMVFDNFYRFGRFIINIFRKLRTKCILTCNF